MLKMYIQRLNYQVLSMKASEAFKIWTQCVENKWEGNRVPLGEGKLDCALTKEPHNYIHILYDMGLPCSKLNNSNLIKDRSNVYNTIYAVSKHSLIQNELVCTFTFKKI